MMTEEETIFCPECGHKNPISNGFCESCGTKLEGVVTPVDPQKTAYEKALQDIQAGNYEMAITSLKMLGDYEDATSQIERAQELLAVQVEQQQVADYDKAMVAFSEGDLATAENLFTRLGDYRDSATKLPLITEAKQQQQKREYDEAYQSGVAAAETATNTSELQQALQYLEQFGDYKDTQNLLQGYQGKQQQFYASEVAQKAVVQNKNKKIMIIVGVLAVIVLGIGWAVHSQQQSAKQLSEKVEQQRSANHSSFDKLDSTVQKEMKAVANTYNANVNDYTYKVTGKTADYEIISYAFKGPDKTKDVLPAKGTRNYKNIAFYRN